MGGPLAREHTGEDATAPRPSARRSWAARLRGAGVLVGLCVKLSDLGPGLGCEQASRTGNAAVAI